MNEKKEYNARIHNDAQKKLRLRYSDKVLLERFNSVKEELIKKYPLHKEFIKSLKAKLDIRVEAPI